MPGCQTLILNPGGSLILSTRSCSTAAGAGGVATGASGESAMVDGWPCFHVGGEGAPGGAVGSCAVRNCGSVNNVSTATAKNVRGMRLMGDLLDFTKGPSQGPFTPISQRDPRRVPLPPASVTNRLG